jgi:hypothetical protein
MAHVARAARVLPLIGALVAAATLTGAAVFTVNQAACPNPGHYQRVGEMSAALVGGCVAPQELPAGFGTAQAVGQDGHGTTHSQP